ncbi:hypothetical protein [Agrobacterium cavarae]|uniref:hypothetical protein n=1 Tax=Agrobacterium cavarae TaxID=2528239 RepID=UPI0028AA2D3B|nr:hypothetical protein [Agrobacterium cavarae]
MLSSVKVTMIAFTAFVVETDDPATDRTVWQNSFGTLDKYRRNHVVIFAIALVCCQ